VGEAYRWKRHLRRTGQWPRDAAKQKITKRATSAKLRFARVRIAPDHVAFVMAAQISITAFVEQLRYDRVGKVIIDVATQSF
jgi:hypothetical protein